MADLSETTLIRYDFAPGEIAALCEEQVRLAEERLTQLLAADGRTFSATIEAFEAIVSDFLENTEALRFVRSVHRDPAVRQESLKAEQLVEKFLIDVYARPELFSLLSAAQQTAATPVQQRLAEHILRDFRRNGMALPEEQRLKVKALMQRLSELTTQFKANLDNNTDYVEVSEEELDGVPATLRSRLQQLNGKYKVTTNNADVFPFMQNAKSAVARKRLLEKYENREAQRNTALLIDALEVRKQAAAILGYKTWADFQIEPKMAGRTEIVLEFLTQIRMKLREQNIRDIEKLLSYKRKEQPGAKEIFPWELLYYENQVKKHELAVDDEEIRSYFPAQRTVEHMFDIYSTLLNIRFREVEGANVWAEHVKLYEVFDADSGELLAHFYTDFFPREGKYSHAAAFTLRSGRVRNGGYVTPIAAIVSNFTPPANDRPSLLTHDEVETLFHEFGHIMHQTLTKAPYAQLSGTNVAWDFVEVPSQMLENWVWDKQMLRRISGHYKTGAPLPDELIDRMVASQRFNQGWFYTRQVLLASFDMALHTAPGAVDPTDLYKRMYREFTAVAPLEESHFPATFGHLMGGYDAGYYGYLWSKVHAQDAFTRFEKEGLLSTRTGLAYRRHILEPGDTRDPKELLREFLGREPSDNAFLKLLGIGADASGLDS
jgi:thimet oligopeptidase